MKYSARASLLCLFACLTSAPSVPAAEALRVGGPADESFRNEIQLAIDRGLAWLQANQNSNGWWSSPDLPALTALPLMALMSEPSGRFREHPTAGVTKG
jgi:squalene-hopene/tetraprenyl-beta-curcumene cyclase